MNKKIVVFAYRLTHDTGFSPGVDNGILTLACCKGGRTYKDDKHINSGLRFNIGQFYHENNNEFEFFLLGIYKDTLLYYAKITEVLEMKEYFGNSKFNNRNDFIYKCCEDGEGFNNLDRNDELPKVHPKKNESGEINKQFFNDINGKYVLLSDKFSYFGGKSEKINDKLLKVLPKRQESFPSKPYEEKTDESMKIHNEVMKIIKEFNLGKNISPHSPLPNKKNKGCYQK